MSLVFTAVQFAVTSLLPVRRVGRQAVLGLLGVGLWMGSHNSSRLSERLDHTIHHVWQLVETVD